MDLFQLVGYGGHRHPNFFFKKTRSCLFPTLQNHVTYSSTRNRHRKRTVWRRYPAIRQYGLNSWVIFGPTFATAWRRLQQPYNQFDSFSSYLSRHHSLPRNTLPRSTTSPNYHHPHRTNTPTWTYVSSNRTQKGRWQDVRNAATRRRTGAKTKIAVTSQHRSSPLTGREMEPHIQNLPSKGSLKPTKCTGTTGKPTPENMLNMRSPTLGPT